MMKLNILAISVLLLLPTIGLAQSEEDIHTKLVAHFAKKEGLPIPGSGLTIVRGSQLVIPEGMKQFRKYEMSEMMCLGQNAFKINSMICKFTFQRHSHTNSKVYHNIAKISYTLLTAMSFD